MEKAPREEGGEKPGNETGLSDHVMGFLAHLEELRIRLIRAILFLLAGTVLGLIFSKYLLNFITSTFPPDEVSHLALLQPTEGFVVRLKVAFVAGLFLTSPLWFSQLWGFISPALYRNEKRIIMPVIILSSGAFIIGAGFGYWILPHAVEYFKSFALEDMNVNWSLGKYFDFSLRLIVAFGCVFEMPLIVYLLARLGIVSTAQLRKYRRHVIIAVMIAAAFITPPDIFTMVVLTVPLIILYEVGILAASIAVRKQKVIA